MNITALADKKPMLKGYILYDSFYGTSLKTEQISGC